MAAPVFSSRRAARPAFPMAMNLSVEFAPCLGLWLRRDFLWAPHRKWRVLYFLWKAWENQLQYISRSGFALQRKNSSAEAFVQTFWRLRRNSSDPLREDCEPAAQDSQ